MLFEQLNHHLNPVLAQEINYIIQDSLGFLPSVGIDYSFKTCEMPFFDNPPKKSPILMVVLIADFADFAALREPHVPLHSQIVHFLTNCVHHVLMHI
jgi:hypothetical protein